MPIGEGQNIVKAPRDFNFFFGLAMERNAAAADAVRRIHSESPFKSREAIHAAFQRELQRLQPEAIAGELTDLSRQVDALLHTAKRRGFRVDGRRTELVELVAEMSELTKATESWLTEEKQAPLSFSLALLEKYRRVLPLLADAIKLPVRASDAPKENHAAPLPMPATM